MKMKKKIFNSILILLLGIFLGIFSKWLDNLSINNEIWWHNIIDFLNLRNIFSELGIWLLIATAISVFSDKPLRASLNVFLFFLGMTVSYHLYTIFFSGFNPKKYMMIWYGLTIISPVLAYICWYAKKDKIISIVISTLILMVMFLVSFSIGMWYFEVRSIIDFLVFIGTLLVIYVKPKNTICSLLSAFVLVFIVRIFI